jgi:ATP-dependent Clp protease ATP-binding subunit ClpB
MKMWRLYIEKTERKCASFLQILIARFKSSESFRWRNNASRTANTTLNEAEIIAKKMNDDFLVEHLILAILIQNQSSPNIKRSRRNRKGLKAAIEELKRRKSNSASAKKPIIH